MVWSATKETCINFTIWTFLTAFWAIFSTVCSTVPNWNGQKAARKAAQKRPESIEVPPCTKQSSGMCKAGGGRTTHKGNRNVSQNGHTQAAKGTSELKSQRGNVSSERIALASGVETLSTEQKGLIDLRQAMHHISSEGKLYLGRSGHLPNVGHL